MANNEDYLAKLEAIKAIADENAKEPNLPMDVFLQECENLYHWSLSDVLKFATVGISKERLDDLPVRKGASREAQSIWTKDYRSQQEAQLRWSEEAPKAYELRNEILHSFRFAFRKDDALMGRVRAIDAGDGNADMIQDLNDLAVLGKENQELLTVIGMDLTILDQASALSDTMATLLAEANGDKAEQNHSKVIHDKAYTHLKELVDEIREAGRYLFWKDKTRLKGYSSTYWRARRSSTVVTTADTNGQE